MEHQQKHLSETRSSSTQFGKRAGMEFIASAAAVVAALLTVVGSLSQLTESTRLRRKVESWRTEATSTPNHYDAKILWSLHRSGIARLVSIEAVPFRGNFIAALVLLFFTYGSFDTGRQIGEIPIDGRTWGGMVNSGIDPIVLFTPLLMAGAVDYILERTLTRREIEHAFMDQASTLAPKSWEERWTSSKDRPLQTVSPIKRAITSFSLCLGLSALLGFLGFVVGLGRDAADQIGWVGLLILPATALILYGVQGGVVSAALDGRTEWKHPDK